MGAGQPEPGDIMIKGCALPVGCRMTPTAVVRKARGHMIGIRGCGKRLSMTTVAIRGSTLETISDVARNTSQLSVSAGETEVCKSCVIESRTLPLVHVVAGFACGREVRRDVIQRSRLREIALMATNAFRAQADEYAGSGSAVTLFARDCRVCTY